MRLWSIHPKYLDTKALVACWREALLAKKVLENQTKGYRNHPQLIRFRLAKTPLAAIDAYLHTLYKESLGRGYRFDPTKIGPVSESIAIGVTDGQVEYEFRHLLGKLKRRDPVRYDQLKHHTHIDPNPLFFVVQGEVEPWEVTPVENKKST